MQHVAIYNSRHRNRNANKSALETATESETVRVIEREREWETEEMGKRFNSQFVGRATSGLLQRLSIVACGNCCVCVPHRLPELPHSLTHLSALRFMSSNCQHNVPHAACVIVFCVYALTPCHALLQMRKTKENLKLYTLFEIVNKKVDK